MYQDFVLLIFNLQLVIYLFISLFCSLMWDFAFYIYVVYTCEWGISTGFDGV